MLILVAVFVFLVIGFNMLAFFTSLPAVFLVNALLLIGLGLALLAKKRHDWKLNSQAENYQGTIENIKADSIINEARMKMLVNNLPMPIVYLNSLGVLEIMNPGFCRFIRDYQSEQTYLYNDRQLAVDIAYILKQAYDSPVNLVFRYNYRDSVYQINTIVLDNQRETWGRLVIFQDISIAAHSEKIQKQFVADASHELKTPISVLKGMLEIMNRPDDLDNEVKAEFMGQMIKETERLEYLVNDLLKLSKSNTETMVLNKQEVNLKDIISTAVKSLAPLYQAKKLKITVKLKTEESIQGDSERLYTAFNNLILNALQNTDHGGITISDRNENDKLVIEIRDTGIGIPADKLPQLFQRFYRIDKARTRNTGGTGLGLAIVKDIIEAHGGTIMVTSKPGQGTVFTIKLKKS